MTHILIFAALHCMGFDKRRLEGVYLSNSDFVALTGIYAEAIFLGQRSSPDWAIGIA